MEVLKRTGFDKILHRRVRQELPRAAGTTVATITRWAATGAVNAADFFEAKEDLAITNMSRRRGEGKSVGTLHFFGKPRI